MYQTIYIYISMYQTIYASLSIQFSIYIYQTINIYLSMHPTIYDNLSIQLSIHTYYISIYPISTIYMYLYLSIYLITSLLYSFSIVWDGLERKKMAENSDVKVLFHYLKVDKLCENINALKIRKFEHFHLD